MYVVATAGHVDHGKSTLVQALTGADPDRLAEEHRRGMTIELGYAWMDLPAGRLAFVDVPGHERFLATMLSGVGPVPAVVLVVAADEGWRRQTTEHVAALDALGVRHGLLVITRCDLADPAAAAADAGERLAETTLAGIDSVAVSAVTGAGLAGLRVALNHLVTSLPPPPQTWRTRLFVDRVFAATGAGTVVTGTLQAGALSVGDRLAVHDRTVTVRGLESCRERVDRIGAVARVAVNLRGVDREHVRRGDTLLTPGAWAPGTVVDVRLHRPAERLPASLVLHVGSAAVPARPRVFAGSDGALARLDLAAPVALQPGDRGVLRDPGRHAVAAGVEVLDVAPPPLGRRGAARTRSAQLAGATPASVLATTLTDRSAVRRSELARLGLLAPDEPVDAPQAAGWVLDPAAWSRWGAELVAASGTPAATAAATLPDPALLAPIAAAHGVSLAGGRLAAAGTTRAVPDRLRPALASLRERLRAAAFAAPTADDLAALSLDARSLAVLADAGELLRLAGEVVLLPDAPELAVRALREVAGPFTLSEARQQLDTTRRVAVPLLEHLDRERLTVRVDGSRRRLR